MNDGSIVIELGWGEQVFGLWCETCLLPSRYKVRVYVLGQDGIMDYGYVYGCVNCDV